ncbi:hypothetical protein GJA_2152 [Janthinobacterium agaricidamnosum NBRC 102515 = DSM 9628]|uniref:Uncharacterized protein n=1 Tax=Janthinobacterium agaricidamnosum NBRC 102515 = DSM 9628 TaxID=1349767 RepID=W0V690_9BURK|nr:hypothetical protein GJA_2152 [Janthinobacterium agaricidamnosum NBRC 102515 = DSM 9628]
MRQFSYLQYSFPSPDDLPFIFLRASAAIAFAALRDDNKSV